MPESFKKLGFTAGTALLLSSPLFSAIFLNIPNIPGESADHDHDKWIDILYVQSGLSMQVLDFRQADYPVHQDISIVKKIDKSSPMLMEALANGNMLSDLTVEVTRTVQSDIRQAYFTYKLNKVFVTSLQTGGSLGESFNTEQVSLNYGRIEWIYEEIFPDGKTGTKAEAWWNVEQNTGSSSSSGGGDPGGGGTTNATPTIQYVPNVVVQPGETRVVDVIVGDSDDPVDSLSITVSTNRPDLIKNLNITGSGSNRTLSFTASSLYSGLGGISVRASDGQAARTLSFTVLIDVEATPFEAYLAAYFTVEELADSLISSPIADPDKDTMATLVEYALGTNPVEFTYPEEAIQVRREIRPEGNFIVINYRRRNDDPNVGPIPWMAPESLSLFTSLQGNPLYEEKNLEGENPLYDNVEGSINIGDGSLDRHFIRMQVTYEQ